MVTPDMGIKVPLTTREGTTLALRQALETLAADPAETARMGKAARQRVADRPLVAPRRARPWSTTGSSVAARPPRTDQAPLTVSKADPMDKFTTLTGVAAPMSLVNASTPT